MYDFDEDVGGFAAGDYLLRSDGRLFSRIVSSWSSGDEYGYRCSPWRAVGDWEGTADADACAAWLRSHRYELREPSRVPIDLTEIGPFPGHPPRR